MKTALDVLKEAYENKAINKGEYDRAVKRIVKTEVEGKKTNREILIGEFRIVEKNGKMELILEEGDIDVLNSAGIMKKEGDLPLEGDDGGKKSVSEEDDCGVEITEDMKRTEDISEEIDWEEGKTRKDVLMDEVRSEIELIDLGKEFEVKDERVDEEEEIEDEEDEAPGILGGIIKRLGGVMEESKEQKLRRLALANLDKVKGIKNEKKAVIGVAYVLKEFLQVKFGITSELTYRGIIDELKTKDIDRQLRNQLIEFFKEMSIMVYAHIPEKDNFSKYHSLAKKTINELSAGEVEEE
ncbi:MAG: hypothetical protein U9Q22_07810 [Candidatus Altiarchaeota archaeon]|nr:hypothetical protein [Candidatus Altiarchaeota archaeon]